MPDAKLYSVFGGHLPDEPDKDIIEVLEMLLAEAKAGHLRAVAYASVNANLDQATGWSGGAGTRHPLGTAIAILHGRYVRKLEGGES